MQIVVPVLRTLLSASLVAGITWAVVDGFVGGPHCACGDIYDEHPRVDAALFGVEMPMGDEGGAYFVETDRVPLVTGATFGWRIKLRDDAQVVRLREELELPAAPRIWRHTEDTLITSDRTTAVTERAVHPSDGWLENAWSFTDGDPAGRYRLRVYLDDELVKEFSFFADDLAERPPCHGG